MRTALLVMTLTLPVAGCLNAPPQTSGNALCDGSRALRTNHAAALAADGGPQSVVTGAALIRALDAGCAAE